MSTVLGYLVKFISTELAKTLIGLSVNKLLEATDDGITKDIATTMIDGIARSKENPTTSDVFEDALALLK